MDPLSICAGVAGFLSLAMEISKILSAYIGDAKSAPKEAQCLLMEVDSLCHVLDQLVKLLREDVKGDFKKTSALLTIITACHDQIKDLYKKLESIRFPREKKILDVVQRMKWPLRKDDYHDTIVTLQRFTQTFQFSLTVSNCELLSKSSTEVLSEFEDKKHQLQKTIDSFKSMQLPFEELTIASKKQSDTFDAIGAMIQLGLNTQSKILLCVQSIEGKANDQEIEGLLRWISPLEPQTRHQDVRLKRLANTGNWFLEMEVFRNWCENDDRSSVLGCYGIPGAGKTVISSLVIDHLSTKFTGENVFVAFLYCDYRDREQQSAVNLIGGLLKQALVPAKKALEEIIGSLRKVKKDRKNLQLSDIRQALSLTLQTFDRVYLCIDALDECDEGERGCFIDCIKELLPADIINSQPIKLFFTARPQVKDYIVTRPSISSLDSLFVTLEANSGDIAAYVTYKLEKDTRVKMEDEFKRTIVAEIVANSEGMFLLPALQIEAVLDEPTVTKRRKALREMPRALHDAFKVTIDRIKSQKPVIVKQAMDILKWVFLANEPLSIEELRHALAVEPGDKNLGWDNFVDAQFLLQCCLGLVIVDESTVTVRLVHKSLQDYLKSQYDQRLLFEEGHDEIAHICVTYMAFSSYKLEVETLNKAIFERYTLLGYATRNWAYHARTAEASRSTIEETIIALIEADGRSDLIFRDLITWLGARSHSIRGSKNYYWPRWSTEICQANSGFRKPGYSLLHLIAFAGLPQVFSRLFKSIVDADINDRDNYVLQTPLHIAALMGYEELVKLILSKYNVNVNVLDNVFDTPLHVAVRRNHAGVVTLLLERDDIELSCETYTSVGQWNVRHNPLSFAARHGNANIVELFLKRGGFDVNLGHSLPIHSTVLTGPIETLEILLKDQRIDVNRKDIFGETPLSIVLSRGQWFWDHKGLDILEILKMLLARKDLDINYKSNVGKTPLSLAIQYGHHDAVELLRVHGAVEG